MEKEKKVISGNKPRYLGLILSIWGLFAAIVVTFVILFILIANGKVGYMPPVEDLENPKNKFATEVYSVDMQVLGRYSTDKGNRVWVDYKDLSPNIVNALIATEDARFESHSGIDAIALVRAIVKRGFFRQKNAGGGSTITQQLAKQLFSPAVDNVMERVFQKPLNGLLQCNWSDSIPKKRLSRCISISLIFSIMR